MSLTRVWIPSPNYSSRGGTSVRLIVVHTTEGAMDYDSLGNYFKGDVGASSHVGIDNRVRGKIGEYVSRSNKAWTQCNCNPYAIAAEQCGYASWSRDKWLNTQNTLLRNTADWIAEEAKKYGIPIKALTASQAQGGAAGVCQHRDLGSYGCGHSDCGSGYPMDKVIEWAGGSASTTPPSQPPQSGSAPAFPYPSTHYLGKPSPPPECHSGYYGNPDNANVKKWQQQMSHRGWSITSDGYYGDQSETVCRQFQAEKGLVSDGLCGPQTWAATWNAPIT